MIQEDEHTNGYGAIGDIKGRPMKASDIKVQKINDLSYSESIDQIADGATEYQCQPNRQKPKILRGFHVKIENKPDGQ